jgi:hypothetical protein
MAICILAAGCGLSKDEKNKAVTAVTPWLELLDSKKFHESWVLTTEYFRGTISAARWTELMQAHRLPLGKTLSRSTKSVLPKTSLPGVPDADYIVIKFNTKFEKKKKAIETLITIVDSKGQIRVAGYYVE